MLRAVAVVLVSTLALTFIACRPGSPGREPPMLTVFAASSLTDAFGQIAADLEAAEGIKVVLSFGASSQLRIQIREGAPADVFASADLLQMAAAREDRSISGPEVVFATNRLVIITPRSNPASVHGIADLGKPGVKVVTASPEVPVGAYTRTALERAVELPGIDAGFRERVSANIVSREPNVRQLVARVQLGEADTAICYETDAGPRLANEVQTIAIPDAANVVAEYPIALVAGSDRAELGRRFISAVMSERGQATLAAWGFRPPRR
ncbi:MAG: molybdate ABC transporter substrate-binding protein [Chloroflexota bacterium]